LAGLFSFPGEQTMLNRRPSAGPATPGEALHVEHAPDSPGAMHILVPTALVPRDRAALLLGLRLAAQQARVTVLHVAPPLEPPNSVHWLDAIDNLHRAMAEPRAAPAACSVDEAMQRACARIRADFERMVPASLRYSAQVRAACRVGDTATEIARFAEKEAVDLVILSGVPSAWRLPFWPSVSRRVLQRTTRPVVFVRPETAALANIAAES